MGASFVILLFLLVGVVVAFELSLRRQGYRHGVSPPRRPPVGFGPAKRSFTGGLRVGWMNASWPLARLTADREALQIRTLFMRRIVVRRADIVAIRRIRSLAGPGIRFETASGAYDGVIFWTYSLSTVVEGLQALGWPLARSK